MLGDAWLSVLARFGPLRLTAARKAAERGMHWVALRHAAADPFVLAALGLYPLARRAPATDRRGRFGRILAAAALEGAVSEDSVAALGTKQRRKLASVLAPIAPDRALTLLPADAQRARAACLLAAGRIDEAAALLPLDETREADLLRAHVALSRGANREGRAAWNAAFARDGIAPPLAPSDDSVSADDFASRSVAGSGGPLVTVVVPYRDAAATLGHALDSLRAQSWRNVEILAVDDGSTDRSAQIAAQAAEQDQRIACLENDGKPGVYAARNRGLDRARGEFVTFLDADDWSPPERLARQVATLEDGAAVAIANHVRIDERGRPVAPRVFPLARPVPITMMLRRALLGSAGPFEEVATGADSEMLGRLQMRFGRRAIARDPAILLVARWRAGSLSEAREGGLFGEERLAYRADWMFRHAGRRLPAFDGAA